MVELPSTAASIILSLTMACRDVCLSCWSPRVSCLLCHSPAGKPIDAAQLEAAEQPSDVAPADLARLSLEEMAASESLPLFVR